MVDAINIHVTKHPNAFIYKFGGNRRMTVIKQGCKDDNGHELMFVQFEILLKLSDEEKAEYIKQNNGRTFLAHREWSKYCIWENIIIISQPALACLQHSGDNISSLLPTKGKKKKKKKK